MATADNTGFTDMGDDWIRLFRVTRSGDNFSLSYQAERHLKLNDPRTGNAAAGTGYYVSPSGELLLYTCEHQEGGPGPGKTVRAGEFRSYNVSQTGMSASERAWIELYWDEEGWDDSSPNRSLMFDQEDFGLDDYLNLDDEAGWAQEADAVRYRAPVGTRIVLYDSNNQVGNTIVLTGDGNLHWIRRLDGSFIDDDPTKPLISGWHDRVRSLFMGVVPVGLGRPYPTISNGLLGMAVVNASGTNLSVMLDPGVYFQTSLVNFISTPVKLEPREGSVVQIFKQP